MKNTKIADGTTTVGEVIADLPLYMQIIKRGQQLGRYQVCGALEALQVLADGLPEDNPDASGVELEWSVKWVHDNPELFAKSFSQFLSKYAGWKLSCTATAGFITIIADRDDESANRIDSGGGLPLEDLALPMEKVGGN